jgi:hypothetical protein
LGEKTVLLKKTPYFLFLRGNLKKGKKNTGVSFFLHEKFGPLLRPPGKNLWI